MPPGCKTARFGLRNENSETKNNVGDLRMSSRLLIRARSFYATDRVVQPLSWAGHIPFSLFGSWHKSGRRSWSSWERTLEIYFAFCQPPLQILTVD